MTRPGTGVPSGSVPTVIEGPKRRWLYHQPEAAFEESAFQQSGCGSASSSLKTDEL